MRAQGEVHYTKTRVDHVGVSRLRQLDAKALKENTNDRTLVIRHRGESLAVLLSYEQYLTMQNRLTAAMETLQILSDKDEFSLLLPSLKEVAGSTCESLEGIRRELDSEVN